MSSHSKDSRHSVLSDREKEKARRFLEQTTREYINLLPGSRTSERGSSCGSLRYRESDTTSVTSKRSQSSRFSNSATGLRTRQYVENIPNNTITLGEDVFGTVPQVDGIAKATLCHIKKIPIKQVFKLSYGFENKTVCREHSQQHSHIGSFWYCTPS